MDSIEEKRQLDKIDFDGDINLEEYLTPQEMQQILANLPKDESKAPDAFSLTQNDLRRELVDRGIQPKGFFNDDAARLQQEYDGEHLAAKGERTKRIIMNAGKKYLYNLKTKQRQSYEEELREEIKEISNDPKLEKWICFAKGNSTPKHAFLQIDSIGCRALAKALTYNTSLRSLNLSGNNLEDKAGIHLAQMLKENISLNKLELDSNSLGPLALKEISASLLTNSHLQYLSLESNPLTNLEKDFTGIVALANALTRNSTLLTLNLWRTRLGIEGGNALAKAIRQNNNLICLDIGNNTLNLSDEKVIQTYLQRNQEAFEDVYHRKLRIKQAQRRAADETRRQLEAIRKKQHEDQWVEEQRMARELERKIQEDRRISKEKEEKEKRLAEELRIQAEKLAKEEADKKKKSKKKDKKKK